MLLNIQIAINWMQDPARCKFGPVSCTRAPRLKSEIYLHKSATAKVKIYECCRSAVRLGYAENPKILIQSKHIFKDSRVFCFNVYGRSYGSGMWLR